MSQGQTVQVNNTQTGFILKKQVSEWRVWECDLFLRWRQLLEPLGLRAAQTSQLWASAQGVAALRSDMWKLWDGLWRGCVFLCVFCRLFVGCCLCSYLKLRVLLRRQRRPHWHTLLKLEPVRPCHSPSPPPTDGWGQPDIWHQRSGYPSTFTQVLPFTITL